MEKETLTDPIELGKFYKVQILTVDKETLTDTIKVEKLKVVMRNR